MKPDWKDAPKWANWLAQDSSGVWIWYSHKPLPDGDQWTQQPLTNFAVVRAKKRGPLEKRP